MCFFVKHFSSARSELSRLVLNIEKTWFSDRMHHAQIAAHNHINRGTKETATRSLGGVG